MRLADGHKSGSAREHRECDISGCRPVVSTNVDVVKLHAESEMAPAGWHVFLCLFVTIT